MSFPSLIPKRIRDQQDFSATPGAGNDGYAVVYDHGTGLFTLGAFLPAASVSAFGLTLIDDTDAAAARTTLGLGTAAVLNVGTGANQIVQLNGSSQLPAVDGSLLTGLSAGSPGGSTTQVQYNNAGVFAGHSGMTYDSANSRLTVSGGLIAGDWSPPSNSTTAVSVWNAARSTRVLTVDTTNSRMRIGNPSVVFLADSRNRLSMQGVLYVENTASDSTSNAGGMFVVASDTLNAFFSARRSRGSISSPSATQNGDVLFNFGGGGYANAAWAEVNVANIRFLAGGNYTASSQPAYITFSTTDTGSTTAIECMRIQSNGHVAIGQTSATALLDLAAPTTTRNQMRWRPGTFATGANLYDGDVGYVSGGRAQFRRGSTTEVFATGVTGSAFTQTYNTAARTVNAYTTDTESAYTGQDNAQVGSVYAKYADLEALRVAYTNLEASHLNLLQVVTAIIDDAQAFGISA